MLDLDHHELVPLAVLSFLESSCVLLASQLSGVAEDVSSHLGIEPGRGREMRVSADVRVGPPV